MPSANNLEVTRY